MSENEASSCRTCTLSSETDAFSSWWCITLERCIIVYCYSIPQVLALRSLHVEPLIKFFPAFWLMTTLKKWLYLFLLMKSSLTPVCMAQHCSAPRHAATLHIPPIVPGTDNTKQSHEAQTDKPCASLLCFVQSVQHNIVAWRSSYRTKTLHKVMKLRLIWPFVCHITCSHHWLVCVPSHLTLVIPPANGQLQ